MNWVSFGGFKSVKKCYGVLKELAEEADIEEWWWWINFRLCYEAHEKRSVDDDDSKPKRKKTKLCYVKMETEEGSSIY